LGSNYLFIMRPPDTPSLIDMLGPWPWYILSLEAIALALCLLLYLPYALRDRRSAGGGTSDHKVSVSQIGRMFPCDRSTVCMDPVIQRLIDWARRRDSIRCMLLTSSRANPYAPVDALSDYDVLLGVTDVRAYHTDRSYLNELGEVLVVYHDPLRIEAGFERFADITQYADGQDRLHLLPGRLFSSGWRRNPLCRTTWIWATGCWSIKTGWRAGCNARLTAPTSPRPLARRNTRQ
jgi:hypothetical protein